MQNRPFLFNGLLTAKAEVRKETYRHGRTLPAAERFLGDSLSGVKGVTAQTYVPPRCIWATHANLCHRLIALADVLENLSNVLEAFIAKQDTPVPRVQLPPRPQQDVAGNRDPK